MPEDKLALQKNVARHLAQDNLGEAQAELKKLLELAPTDPLALVLGGDVSSRSGEARQSYRFYNQAAEVFQKQGLWDKVLAVQQRLIKLDPADLDDAAANRIRLLVFIVDAENKLQAGDTAGAVEGYQAAIHAHPNHTLAYQRLASLYLQLGRYPEALEQYLVVGRAFLAHRLFAKAKPYFQRVMELDPKHEEGQNALADIMGEEGHPGEASRYYMVAAEHALQKGQFERASGFITKLQALGAEEALYLLGILYAKQGRKEEAKNALATFVRTAKQYSKALTQLGELFEQEGRLDLALKCFQRAAQDATAAKARRKVEDLLAKAAAAKGGPPFPTLPAMQVPVPPPPVAQAPTLPAPRVLPPSPAPAVAVPYSPAVEEEPAQNEGPAAALSLTAKPVAEEDIGVLTTMGDMCLAEEMFEEAKQVFERLLRADSGNEDYFVKLNQARVALNLTALSAVGRTFTRAVPIPIPVPAVSPAPPVIPQEAAPPAQPVSQQEEAPPPPAPAPPVSQALPQAQPEPVAEEVAEVKVVAKMKTLPPKTLPVAVLPSRRSSLPKDPLDFLMQMEGQQAAPPAEPEKEAPPLPKVLEIVKEKKEETRKEIAETVKKALAGELTAADKVKITGTKLEYQVGELPPSFKSQVALDEDVIE